MPQTYTDENGRQVTIYQPTSSAMMQNFLGAQDVAAQRRADPGTYLQDTYNWMTKNLAPFANEVGSYTDKATQGMTYGQRAEYYNPFLQFVGQGNNAADWYKTGQPQMAQAASQGYRGGPMTFNQPSPAPQPAAAAPAQVARPALTAGGVDTESGYMTSPNVPAQRNSAGMLQTAATDANTGLGSMVPDRGSRTSTLPAVGTGRTGGAGFTTVDNSRTGSGGISQTGVPGGTDTATGNPPASGGQWSDFFGSLSRLGGVGATDQQQEFLQQISRLFGPMISNGLFNNPQQGLTNGLGGTMSDWVNYLNYPQWMSDMSSANTLNSSMAGTQGNWLGNSFQPTMNANLQYLNQNGLPQTQGLQNLIPQLSQYGGNLLGMNGQGGVGQLLQQIMSGGLPNQSAIQNLVGSQLGQAGTLQGGNGQGYGLTDLFQQLMTKGLPGQTDIQNMVGQGLGQSNAVLGQAGGTAEQGNYGLIPMLQQIMQRGLPGQQNITDMIGSLSQSAQQGGMTPEQVQAYTRLIYDPMQERLLGDLNKMGGGAANLGSSGQMQELQRRSNQAFQDMLLTKAMEQVPQLASTAGNLYGQIGSAASPYANLAAQLGQQGQQNALNAFTAVPGALQPYISQAGNQAQNAIQNALSGFQGVASSAYPYVNLASQTGQNALSQALQNYTGTNQLGLQNLSTINNLAYQPYNTGMSNYLQGMGMTAGASNDALGQIMNFLTSQQGNYNQQYGMGNDLLQTMLGGIYGTGQGNAAVSASNRQAIGQMVAAAIAGLASMSDSSLKNDIRHLDAGLNAVLQMNPVSFTYKPSVGIKGKQLGLVAQELREVLPELVGELPLNGSNYRAINYQGLIPVLINAVKELKAEVDALRKEKEDVAS